MSTSARTARDSLQISLSPSCSSFLRAVATLAPIIRVSYRTAKIEYGMVENDESIFGYDVELRWYGLFGGFEACHDMTGVNDRRGSYNEIEICTHVKLIPGIDFYDYFTESQRKAYDKFNGFVAVAGCRLAVEF